MAAQGRHQGILRLRVFAFGWEKDYLRGLKTGEFERRMRTLTRQEKFLRGRRGLCLAEIDLTMVFGGLPSEANAGVAPRIASRMRFCTSGSSRCEGALNRRLRTMLPLPLSSFAGSASFAPLRKQSVTHSGNTASDSTASEALSVGPNPNTRAL